MGEVLIAEVLITKSTQQQKEGYFFSNSKGEYFSFYKNKSSFSRSIFLAPKNKQQKIII